MRKSRTVELAAPSETGSVEGLAYTLWLPERATAGVVVLHGADSQKENHHDFARALLAVGLAAMCFDLRGHGASRGFLDDRAAEDVATVAEKLREAIAGRGGPLAAPLALRGSSMGGYLALVAAGAADAQAVVAICPAGSDLLRSGVARGAFGFPADVEALDAFLEGNDLITVVDELEIPVLLLHAAGDERVPVEQSRELATHLQHPGSRLIEVPGGHHRSIQHDPELQAISLGFLRRALGAG